MEISKYLKTDTPEREMALRNCIFLFLTGSHLYGTNTPNSDKDYEGVFIEDPDYVLGTKRVDEIDFSTKSSSKNERNTKDDIDCKFYSLRKFIELAKLNNPNKIEWFFVPQRNIIEINANYWNQITRAKDLFLSLKLKHSFTGYAFSQKSKLITKKQRLDALRQFRNLLDTTIKTGGTTIGDCHKTMFDTSLPGRSFKNDEYELIKTGQLSNNDIGIIIDGREYNFGMNINTIYENISREIDRYGHRTAGLDTMAYDTKFASHIFRLYYEGLSLLKEGEIHYPLQENQFILDVKNGKYSLDEVLAKAESIEPLFEMAYINSTLRHAPDINAISDLQKSIHLEYWKSKKLI